MADDQSQTFPSRKLLCCLCHLVLEAFLVQNLKKLILTRFKCFPAGTWCAALKILKLVARTDDRNSVGGASKNKNGPVILFVGHVKSGKTYRVMDLSC